MRDPTREAALEVISSPVTRLDSLPRLGEWRPYIVSSIGDRAVVSWCGADDERFYFGEPGLTAHRCHFRWDVDRWACMSCQTSSFGEIAIGWTGRPRRWITGSRMQMLGESGHVGAARDAPPPVLRFLQGLAGDGIEILRVVSGERVVDEVRLTGRLGFFSLLVRERGELRVEGLRSDGIIEGEISYRG